MRSVNYERTSGSRNNKRARLPIAPSVIQRPHFPWRFNRKRRNVIQIPPMRRPIRRWERGEAFLEIAIGITIEFDTDPDSDTDSGKGENPSGIESKIVLPSVVAPYPTPHVRPSDPMTSTNPDTRVPDGQTPESLAPPRRESPILLRLRLTWIHAAFPALAVLSYLWTLKFSAEHIGYLSYGSMAFAMSLALSLFWILAGIRAGFLAASRHPDNRWIPRRLSLLLALFVLMGALAFYGSDLDPWQSLKGDGYQPGSAGLSAVWFLLVGVAMLLHAEGVRARAGSPLFGWFLTLPMIDMVAPFLFEILLRLEGNPGPFASVEGVSILLSDAAAVLGCAWGFLMLGEYFLTRNGAGSRPSSETSLPISAPVDAQPVPSPPSPSITSRSLPMRLAIAAAPFFFAMTIFSTIRDAGFRLVFDDLIPAAHMVVGVAIFVFVLLGLGLGLRGLRAEHGPRARPLVYLIVLSGGFAFLFLVGDSALSPLLRPAWLLAVVACMFVADARDSRRAAKTRRESGDEPTRSDSSHVVRSLLRFPWSPLRRWGAGARRPSMVWIMPPALWVIAFVILIVGILIGRRNMGRPITLESLFSPHGYGPGFWTAYLVILFAVGVIIPLIFFVPWRIAGRFQQVWDPVQLRELALTNLSSWDIFWAIILAPIRSTLILTGTTLLYLAPIFLVVTNRGHEAYRADIGLAAAAAVVLVPTVVAAMMSLLVIGYARRGKRAGLVALGAAAMTLVAWIGGLIAAFVLLREASFTLVGETGIFLYLVVVGILWAFRRAFAGLPETMERLVGE